MKSLFPFYGRISARGVKELDALKAKLLPETYHEKKTKFTKGNLEKIYEMLKSIHPKFLSLLNEYHSKIEGIKKTDIQKELKEKFAPLQVKIFNLYAKDKLDTLKSVPADFEKILSEMESGEFIFPDEESKRNIMGKIEAMLNLDEEKILDISQLTQKLKEEA